MTAVQVTEIENRGTTRYTVRSYASALLWTAYIALPCRAIGLFHGIPLRPFDVFVLLLIWWLLLVNQRIPGSRAAAAATMIVLLFTLAVPGEPGFRARYYA